MEPATDFLRVGDNYSTSLAQDLIYSDTEIFVNDASILPQPDPEGGVPGVVFVNGERITYYRNYINEVVAWTANTAYGNSAVISYDSSTYVTTANVAANTVFDTSKVRSVFSANALGQIRRGTWGTAAANVISTGRAINDGSPQTQRVPNTTFGTTTLSSNLTVGNAYVRTILAGTTLVTSNIWQNPGAGTAADGTGFSGGTTVQILFLKDQPSESEASLAQLPVGTLTNEVGTDALVNEAGTNVIIKE